MLHPEEEVRVTALRTSNIKNVREFAKNFVRSVIDEAIKQSSKTTWLIHCSENCHRINPVHLRKLNSYICWTPELIATDSYIENITQNVEDDCSNRVFSCNSVEMKNKISTVSEDVYTLPVDTVGECGAHSTRFKPVDSHDYDHKYLKPKAIHALNLLKSSHQKTFSDFKLFLINLYSSSDMPPKKLGSEHSAFRKYYGVESATVDSQQDRKKRKKKEDNFSIIHIKTEKDLKISRKCSRIKLCNFLNISHSFCNVFKLSKSKDTEEDVDPNLNSFKDRSLPPLPSQVCGCPCEKKENLQKTENVTEFAETEESTAYSRSAEYNYVEEYTHDDDYLVHRSKASDFATNIEKVKDYGWYWGPMSSEAAEKLLQNEKDGSFIVRDSSDDRYIFSLTFKLNACIRHVRIEHGQGNFSFGTHTSFQSQTIVDFIENAVQHSRSGRYLFFLHRRPILGPMRVQLLYPVSRFKHVQSLQHMCRFVILKTVRRDLITSLPLPKSLIEYLSCKDYYIEQNF